MAKNKLTSIALAISSFLFHAPYAMGMELESQKSKSSSLPLGAPSPYTINIHVGEEAPQPQEPRQRRTTKAFDNVEYFTREGDSRFYYKKKDKQDH